jgi:predicted transcriptional regulator
MRQKPETEDGDLLVVLGMFHGIYSRVARKLGVNQSTVSRVARGKRTSTKVSKAIHNELRSIRDYLNRAAKELNGGSKRCNELARNCSC